MDNTQIYRGQICLQKKCEVITDTPEIKADDTKLFVVTVNELVTNEGCNLRMSLPALYICTVYAFFNLVILV